MQARPAGRRGCTTCRHIIGVERFVVGSMTNAFESSDRQVDKIPTNHAIFFFLCIGAWTNEA